MLVAKAIVRGDPLELYEFPMAPKSIDDYAIKRALSAPEPVRDGFHLVLSDALRPPFAAGQFDTVITPWLVDVIVEHRIRRVGGDDIVDRDAMGRKRRYDPLSQFVGQRFIRTVIINVQRDRMNATFVLFLQLHELPRFGDTMRSPKSPQIDDDDTAFELGHVIL